MEKIVVNGVVVCCLRLERTYKALNLRRALISLNDLSKDSADGPGSPTQPIPGGGGGGERGFGGEGAGRSRNGGTTFETLDPNVVIILVVLLFALICAAFLNSIMRCVMHRSSRAQDPPEESQSVQGLDAKALAILPVLSFKGAQFQKLKDGSPVECPVCLSEFVENEKVRLLPKCNHVFHIDCIDTWLLSHVSCPVCRDSVVEDPKLQSSAIVVIEEQSDSLGNSTTAHSHVRAELQHETGTSSSAGISNSALVVHSSSLVGSSSSSSQDVASGSRWRGRGVRASLSSMFAAENVMLLFTSNLGPGSRGHGPGRAASSSSASTS